MPVDSRLSANTSNYQLSGIKQKWRFASELQPTCFKRKNFHNEGLQFRLVLQFLHFHFSSESSWPVFVDKSTSMQTTGDRNNILATKAITKNVSADQLRNTHFSQLTGRLLGKNGGN